MSTPALQADSAARPTDRPALGRTERIRLWRPGIHHAALVVILAISAELNTRRLSQNGFANIYYSAAIRSMLRSLHNFFFVAADPGGLITVDKPPLGVWTQAISAKVFGFSPLSLLLPEAILGVLAVAALYAIVARRFGPVAGLAAGLALAVFPSFVAVSRDNNLDTLLILFMLLSAGAGIRAAETGRLRWLVACAALAGLAFNTKALAAFLIVPGLAAAYLVCPPLPVRTRLVHLGVAGLVGAAVSVAWLGYVDATSTAHRPFVGGSTNNSEFNVTFSYNGLGRVGGQVGGPHNVPQISQLPTTQKAPAVVHRGATRRPAYPRHLVTFPGPAGPFRLLDRELGDQGGWILPFALVGTLGVALIVRDRRDPRLAALFVLGGWFAAEAGVLSVGQGIIHPYYVSAVGPGAAAMTGAGLVALAELGRRRRRSWQFALGGAALATAVVGQVVMMHRDHYLGPWPPILIAVVAACALACIVWSRHTKPALAVAVAALLVAPTAYSATTWDVPVEGTFPAAGPSAVGGHGGVGVVDAARRFNVELLAFARAEAPHARFAVLTDASSVAAPMILLGGNVAAIGGYSGADPALDARGLAHLVSTQQARFLLMGGVFWSRGGNGATRATVRACLPVPASVWRPVALRALAGHPVRPGPLVSARAAISTTFPTSTSFVLYDCQGRAARILGG